LMVARKTGNSRATHDEGAIHSSEFCHERPFS